METATMTTTTTTTTTTTFEDGQIKPNEEDEDILMFVEYGNCYDFDVKHHQHHHHQDHRSRRRRKCDFNDDNDSSSSSSSSSYDTSENVISKIQRLPPQFSMSNNLLWKSLIIIVSTIMCSYSSNSYWMVQAQSSSLANYYYNNQNDNQRPFHHIRWHSNPPPHHHLHHHHLLHHHHHQQQGKRIFFPPFTFFHQQHQHHHHPHHHHHQQQQNRIPQIHQYYQVMPIINQSKQQPQQSIPQKPPSTPSIHHLNNLIRKNSLLKHRKHRHTYYSDDILDLNSTITINTNATTGRKILSSSFRQNNARSLPLSASSSSDEATPIINSANTKIIYQLNWIKSDQELPLCEKRQVCNKIDTYSTPWIEKQCRCPSSTSKCSLSLNINDEHTVQVESTKQYKLCETVKTLPTCRYFRDIAYTITTQKAIRNDQKEFNSLLNNHHGLEGMASNDNTEDGKTVNQPQQQHIGQQQQSSTMDKFQNENITKQEINCVCPPHSVTYIMKHQVYRTLDGQLGYRYYFVCSPETKLRCRRKEPCRLFTAKKRSKIEAVTATTLCQCQNGQKCPENHWQTSVMLGTSYPLDNIRTYSGYCYSDSTTTLDDPDVADSENHQPESMMIENR